MALSATGLAPLALPTAFPDEVASVRFSELHLVNDRLAVAAPEPTVTVKLREGLCAVRELEKVWV